MVVIGATNRPDNIDPALRRPGRFDRELHFALPSAADRAAILAVHTRGWQAPPSDALLAAVASATPGFAGAWLALCIVWVGVGPPRKQTLQSAPRKQTPRAVS